MSVSSGWGRFTFFNDTATTEIYTGHDTLSLHDALPIWRPLAEVETKRVQEGQRGESRNCGQVLVHLLDAVLAVGALGSTREEEELNGVGLTGESNLLASEDGSVVDVDGGASRVDPEDRSGVLLAEAHHVGDRTVERAGLVGRVQMIRGEQLVRVRTLGVLEREGVLTLRDAEEGLVLAWDVEAH